LKQEEVESLRSIVPLKRTHRLDFSDQFSPPSHHLSKIEEGTINKGSNSKAEDEHLRIQAERRQQENEAENTDLASWATEEMEFIFVSRLK